MQLANFKACLLWGGGGGQGRCPWAKARAGAGLVHSLNPEVYFLSFYPQSLSLKNSLRVHAAASNWGGGGGDESPLSSGSLKQLKSLRLHGTLSPELNKGVGASQMG